MNILTAGHRGGELLPVITKEPFGRPEVETNNRASWLEVLAEHTEAEPETSSCKEDNESGPSTTTPVRGLPRVKNRPLLLEEIELPPSVAPIIFPQWMPSDIVKLAKLELNADGDGNGGMETSDDSLSSTDLASSTGAINSLAIAHGANLPMGDSTTLLVTTETPQCASILASINSTASITATPPIANPAAHEMMLPKPEGIAVVPSALTIAANEKPAPDTARSSSVAGISGINLIPAGTNRRVANRPDLEPLADSTTMEGTEEMTRPDAPDKRGTIHGMTAAEQDGTMKPRQDEAEIAEWFSRGFLARQNSTGDGRRVQPVFTANWRSNHSVETGTESVAAADQATMAITAAKAEIFSDAMEVAKAAPTTQLGLHIVEQAVHFKRNGLDSLEVVLKPDAQMEIRLHFITRDGQVEARAHCERGDTSQLSTEWNQLQDSLMKQGIRLLPLGDLAIGSNGLGGHSDNSRPSVPVPEPADAVRLVTKSTTPVPLVSKAEHSAIQRVMTHLGLLDSWA